MTKSRTDLSPSGTMTIDPPKVERAEVVGEKWSSHSTKSKELNARMAPASYKEGHENLRYSPKEPPISETSTENK